MAGQLDGKRFHQSLFQDSVQETGLPSLSTHIVLLTSGGAIASNELKVAMDFPANPAYAFNVWLYEYVTQSVACWMGSRIDGRLSTTELDPRAAVISA